MSDRTESEKFMELINQYRVNHGENTYEKLQAFADSIDSNKAAHKQLQDLRGQMAFIGQLWNGHLKFATMRQSLMAIMEVVNMNVNHANNLSIKKHNKNES